MLLTISEGMDSFLQLCTVLFIFVLVLAITWAGTKLIANMQNGQGGLGRGTNIEVIETYRLTANKYIQIVRAGEKYLAVAVCKDTVTMLAEIPAGQIHLPEKPVGSMPDFKKLLEVARRKNDNRKNEE